MEGRGRGSPQEPDPGCARGGQSVGWWGGGQVRGPGRGRLGTRATGSAGSSLGSAKLERAVRVGVGGGSPRGRRRTHRGRRRGCPRARGRRAAWRRRVAGKVPGSGGRPAPPRAGLPWCALGPGAPPPHIGAQETADPAPAVPCRMRPGCPAATSAPCPLNPARPGSSPRRAPAQPQLLVASARPTGRLRLRDSSLPRKATVRGLPPHPLLPTPPARPEEAVAEGSAA